MLVDALTGTGAAGHRTSSKTAAHTAAGGLTFEPRTSGYSRLATRQQAEDEGLDDAQHALSLRQDRPRSSMMVVVGHAGQKSVPHVTDSSFVRKSSR